MMSVMTAIIGRLPPKCIDEDHGRVTRTVCVSGILKTATTIKPQLMTILEQPPWLNTPTISEMETAFSTHSDNITSLEQDVVELHSKLTSITEENGALQAAVEDLVSRSKRQNLRVIGLPEDIEGNNPRQFMADLFQEVAAEALSNSTPELDRDHRSLRPKPRQRSRSVIVRFHRYIDKERGLLWGKEHRNMTYQGHNIKFYEDFSGAVAKRRAAFNQVKSLLFKKGIRFGMIYPARLRVTFDGVTHIFDSPEQAELFYEERIRDS
ncbi:hypothetical protein F2P81_016508 [Scophthalmus maximus]|uniref:Transposase element L1Md-A101/L1Md-A102/L1Md-A2 n=1 Tax=Scophthalmus maximus TaxID=52904 RepID=A0A6A4SCR8_SCOMX|nr:hypothetical protein F2P81_016508 [Scophthalmus maximus]